MGGIPGYPGHPGSGPCRGNRHPVYSAVALSPSVLCAAFYGLSKVTHALTVTHAPFVPREYISRHNGAHLQLCPQCFKNVTDFIVSDSQVCSEKPPRPQPRALRIEVEEFVMLRSFLFLCCLFSNEL